MKIGYLRVSTEEQNEERQIKLLKEYMCDKIYLEKKSGKNTNREELNNMLKFAREDDIIIVESISRIARNTKDLLLIIEDLNNRNIGFISLKEAINTLTPQGKFMVTIFGAMAELEREQILQRQKEGIAIAKEKGLYCGRKRIQVNSKQFKKIYDDWKSNKISGVKAQQLLGIKANTFYRRVKEYEDKK